MKTQGRSLGFFRRRFLHGLNCKSLQINEKSIKQMLIIDRASIPFPLEMGVKYLYREYFEYTE